MGVLRYEFRHNVGFPTQLIENKQVSNFQYISGYMKALCLLTHSVILFIIYYVQNLQLAVIYHAVKQNKI